MRYDRARRRISQRYYIIRGVKRVADEGIKRLPVLYKFKLKWEPSAISENFLPIFNISYILLIFINDFSYRGYKLLHFFYRLEKGRHSIF